MLDPVIVRIVLILIPSVVAFALHIQRVREVWRPPQDNEPINWKLSPVSPLLIACFSPLATAAAIPAKSVGLVYTCIVSTALALGLIWAIMIVASTKGYYGMYDPLHIRRLKFGHLDHVSLLEGIGGIVIALLAAVQVVVIVLA